MIKNINFYQDLISFLHEEKIIHCASENINIICLVSRFTTLCMLSLYQNVLNKTRTRTSIRYAKENIREKRERRREREIEAEIERER